MYTDANLAALDHVPGGEPEPGARQQRRILLCLCHARFIAGGSVGDYATAFRFGQLGMRARRETWAEALPGQDLSELCRSRPALGETCRNQSRPGVAGLRTGQQRRRPDLRDEQRQRHGHRSFSPPANRCAKCRSKPSTPSPSRRVRGLASSIDIISTQLALSARCVG